MARTVAEINMCASNSKGASKGAAPWPVAAKAVAGRKKAAKPVNITLIVIIVSWVST